MLCVALYCLTLNATRNRLQGVIKSFRCDETERLFHREPGRKFCTIERSALRKLDMLDAVNVRIPGQGGHDSEIDPVIIPKLIRSRFRDEVGQGFRF